MNTSYTNYTAGATEDATAKARQDLWDRCRGYVEEHAIEIYPDYHDKLSAEQIRSVLEGYSESPDKGLEALDAIECEISRYAMCNNMDYYLPLYFEEMADALDVDPEAIDDWRNNDPDMFYPSFWTDIHAWLRNSEAHITAKLLDADGNRVVLPFGYASEWDPDNEDVDYFCEALGLNPRRLAEAIHAEQAPMFEDRTERTDPAINATELLTNLCVRYDGVVCFMLDDPASVVKALQAESVTLTRGTTLIVYDYFQGAGITEAILLRDVTLPRGRLSFDVDNDNRYGIDSCYGGRTDWGAGSVVAATTTTGEA
jgi:hypothetical protein